MRGLYAVLVISAVLAGTAPAAQAAMNGIPTPPHVTIIHGPCPDAPDAFGCADQAGGIIYLADRDSFTRQHELGHLADWQLLDSAEQYALEPLLGVRKGIAWQTSLTGWDCDDVHPCPAELFADAYAMCRLGYMPDEGRWVWSYGYSPNSNRDHRRTCRAIRRYLAD